MADIILVVQKIRLFGHMVMLDIRVCKKNIVVSKNGEQSRLYSLCFFSLLDFGTRQYT